LRSVPPLPTLSTLPCGQARRFASVTMCRRCVTGKRAHIIMPDNAPAVKRAAVLGYGAKVVTCESTQEAREAAANKEQTVRLLTSRAGGWVMLPWQ